MADQKISSTSLCTPQYCLQQGLPTYIEDAARLLLGLGSAQSCSSTFMAEYLSAVVSGQHVLWRHYAYVAATHHNRKMFLACARRSLTPTAQAGRLSMGDVHSLLQLLCPDFPPAAVRNAWSSAVAMQTWSDQVKQQQQQQQQQHTTAAGGEGIETGPMVQLQVFLQCFEVVFFFEHYLMALRKNAFTQDKACMGLQKLDGAMSAAAAALPSQGWPVPAAGVMKRAINQASRAATYPDFAFGELVKALCSSQELVLELRRELAAATASAASAAAANSSCPNPNASRPSSSSDDSSSEEDSRQQRQRSSASDAGPASATGMRGWTAGDRVTRTAGSMGSSSMAAGSGRPWK